MEIGERIRNLRQEKRMTLVGLSSKSGVAPATLSRIENGLMTGTLKSHMKIAQAFGISLTDLYHDLEAKRHEAELLSEKQKNNVFVHDEKTSSILLTSQALTKKMMPILIRLTQDGKTHIEEAPGGTEKFLYGLSGTMEVTVGYKKYSLGPSDTLYFDASLPHSIKNAGKSEAKCLSVSSPPTL